MENENLVFAFTPFQNLLILSCIFPLFKQNFHSNPPPHDGLHILFLLKSFFFIYLIRFIFCHVGKHKVIFFAKF